MDVTSELADLRGVPLHELAATAPMAMAGAVARVNPETDVVAPGPSFNSTI